MEFHSHVFLNQGSTCALNLITNKVLRRMANPYGMSQNSDYRDLFRDQQAASNEQASLVT
jgi:hypothetical protein